jgi:tetratricopeptide (TPR) repeat protein
MEHYCSPECQKKDWKKHKLMCPMLKKLSNKIQPFHEVTQVILDVFQLNDKPQHIRVLEFLLSYAEYQFGERVVGQSYRERADGERISNWLAEYENIFQIIDKIIDIDDSNNVDDSVFDTCYQEKSLRILSSWLICLDSDANCQLEHFDKANKGLLLDQLYLKELQIGQNCMKRQQYDEAEIHCERMLYYSKRFDDDDFDKTNKLSKALGTLVVIMYNKGDFKKAKKLAEDMYNLVAIAYNPSHPEVQEAAALLIRTLFRTGDTGDLEDAERFAEVTYGYLKDPSNGINPEGPEVAEGGYNYAEAIKHRNGNLIKAEKIARESLRIREILAVKDKYRGITEILLNEILEKQRANEL